MLKRSFSRAQNFAEQCSPNSQFNKTNTPVAKDHQKRIERLKKLRSNIKYYCADFVPERGENKREKKEIKKA